MTHLDQNINNLLELANLYPSPHNGQPIRLKQTGENSFDIYFERERGLQAADISFIFSFVSMGVFTEHMSLCAQALGHKFSYSLDLPKEEDLRGHGVIKFAKCSLKWNIAEPDPSLLEMLHFRQTSRKKYYEGISQELSSVIEKLAADGGMSLVKLDDQQAKSTIWLNQRAVFDDMFDEPVRQELDHWLRYSKRQKLAKKDGLSYDCMELNGSLMKLIVDHPKILRMPGISWVTKEYYLRTMTDSSNVYYMLAPFASGQDAFDVGLIVMKVWKEIALRRYYLHPFGTIMSNHAAHKDFLKLVNVEHESREHDYLVFIFRCGKSKLPHPSLRIPFQNHLILE